MARINNLTNFLIDVAAAIKDKKGDDTDILAADFDTEILALPSQGGAMVFASVEEMEETTSADDGTLAIVSNDDEYIGSYIFENGTWSKLEVNQTYEETMNILDDVLGESDEYEGLGGTEQEIENIMDEILEG